MLDQSRRVVEVWTVAPRAVAKVRRKWDAVGSKETFKASSGWNSVRTTEGGGILGRKEAPPSLVEIPCPESALSNVPEMFDPLRRTIESPFWMVESRARAMVKRPDNVSGPSLISAMGPDA